jgi:hypothetical protein
VCSFSLMGGRLRTWAVVVMRGRSLSCVGGRFVCRQSFSFGGAIRVRTWVRCRLWGGHGLPLLLPVGAHHCPFVAVEVIS